MQFEAMLNYHTACVFFRVMETMVPSKANSMHHARLMYAAQKTRQTSSLYQNFVRENFTGGSCSEVYEVHGSSKLGKGSYGSVYLATHRVTGDERAVKVMNVDRITSYYLRKLHTEIAILKSLDHPNIIKLQDVFFGKRSVYIVTDLCRGGELFELLNSGKNQGFVFREDRASKLMKDMLSAVHYLHENGIVHRDLKLENFLFEDNNANSSLILIDFGLSKHFTPEERLTQKVGSCYYTAPEVLNGNYDCRCDIWSLGVLCYMLLSGSPPFYGKSVEDVYQAILTKDASFADKKFKHVSNCCMDFMKRLLVRDPRYRMTTGEALLHPFITGASFFPRYTNSLSTAPAGPRSSGNDMEVDSGASSVMKLTSAQCGTILER
jgi:calcium-dependent protein kinase